MILSNHFYTSLALWKIEYVRGLAYGIFLSPDPLDFDDGPNKYLYTGANPLNWTDPWGLDKTEWYLIENGRTAADGPRNGNWGGKNWSGGKGGGKIGTAPYTDSGDLLYMQHGFGWARCEKKYGCNSEELKECKRQYNKELVDKAKKLPDDPRDWPEPPKKGTEEDSRNFKELAIEYFKKIS
ncbi:MAG: hypothetical protein HYS08_06950 [Chlamydiae bacterium]|nr:hypothetical protein [Chlamydiota bacterium]MBI3266403.1 hypothetical protein [Chlamydiota bacterium]